MPTPYPFPATQFRLVGKVTKAHGLKGELKVVSLAGDPEQFRTFSRVALVAIDGRMTSPLPVVTVRRQQDVVILKLATIDTRSEAALTVGMGVLLPAEAEPPVVPGEESAAYLVGRQVFSIDPTGPMRCIGTIRDWFSNGAQEVLVVENDGQEILIPLVSSVIVSIDDQRVIIDPPPGLLTINEPAAT